MTLADPIDRECRQCGALPGKKCTRKDGKTIPMVHNVRLREDVQHKPARHPTGQNANAFRRDMFDHSADLLAQSPSTIAARRLPDDEIRRAVEHLPLKPPGRA
jgi:hypothetical protein